MTKKKEMVHNDLELISKDNIVIFIEDGMIQYVYTDMDTKNKNFIVVDWDTEASDDERLIETSSGMISVYASKIRPVADMGTEIVSHVNYLLECIENKTE